MVLARALAVALVVTFGVSAPAMSAPASGAPAPSSRAVSAPRGDAQRPPGSTSRKTGAARSRNPTVVLYHINSREKVALRFADDRGRPVPGVQKRMNRFLRCHHTQAQGRMNPRLVRLLYETGRKYPGRRLEVVSGYRHAKAARNPRSPHKRGLACDLRVEGVKNTELRDFFRTSFRKVGVGYYPNSSFVHLDVRDGPSAFWIDYSGPGEGAMYAENPRDDLENGRAEAFRPTTIDLSWAEEPEATLSPGPGAPAPESP